ncbi:hypothetical protein KQ945_16455 [Bacillus subtilis subsp. subtilis]|nr:hypothetical protein [Bacillus subtilis subsp. subtilis]
MLKQLHARYDDPAAANDLLAQCRAQVVRWRWANESMGWETPFAREEQGGPASRWVADDKANPQRHVRHGLDAQDRVVLECWPNGCATAWLHAPGVHHSLSFFADGGINAAWEYREQDGRLLGLDLVDGKRGFNETYYWEGDRLQRKGIENWSQDGRTWWCQKVYHYNDAGQLDTIVLEYLDDEGCPGGPSRLQYQRPRPGETLATVTAEVERLLIEAIAAQLPRIPRGEPLYCLLLCFTDEDPASAWPPFLVWGRQPYRQEVLERGEDVRYYLWAPDEIRQGQGDAEEHWFDVPALTQACQRHSQYMEVRGSTASAQRVLKQVAAWLDAPQRRALLDTTDDFVVAVADNSGNIDPVPGLRRAIDPQHWALLKARGCV